MNWTLFAVAGILVKPTIPAILLLLPGRCWSVGVGIILGGRLTQTSLLFSTRVRPIRRLRPEDVPTSLLFGNLFSLSSFVASSFMQVWRAVPRRVRRKRKEGRAEQVAALADSVYFSIFSLWVRLRADRLCATCCAGTGGTVLHFIYLL